MVELQNNEKANQLIFQGGPLQPHQAETIFLLIAWEPQIQVGCFGAKHEISKEKAMCCSSRFMMGSSFMANTFLFLFKRPVLKKQVSNEMFKKVMERRGWFSLFSLTVSDWSFPLPTLTTPDLSIFTPNRYIPPSPPKACYHLLISWSSFFIHWRL